MILNMKEKTESPLENNDNYEKGKMDKIRENSK